MPFVEKEKYELPSKCRLHPENDMFREQEEHKMHFDINEWRCGFCKKSFRAEKFIDQHFANRHSNLVDNSQGRCLADLCGALHCDLTMEFKKPKSKCNAALQGTVIFVRALLTVAFLLIKGIPPAGFMNFSCTSSVMLTLATGVPNLFPKVAGNKQIDSTWLSAS